MCVLVIFLFARGRCLFCVLPGSSRTDAGVHAFANTCHLDLRRVDKRGNVIEEPHPATTVQMGISHHLHRAGHHDITVVGARLVSPHFHARHAAIGRTYRYYIVDAAAPAPAATAAADAPQQQQQQRQQQQQQQQVWDPHDHHHHHHHSDSDSGDHRSRLHQPAPGFFDSPFSWFLPDRCLDVAAMAEAVRTLEGHHDFSSFRSSGCQAKSPVKTMHRAQLEVVPGGGIVPGSRRLCVTLHASGFLYHQVG